MLDALQRLIDLDSIEVLFMVLSTFTLIIGVVLAVSPPLFQRLAQSLNRSYSARQALKSWEVPRTTERFFYRHHRFFGLFIILGVGVYYAALWDVDRAHLVKGLTPYLPNGTANWIVPGVMDIFAFSNVMILLIGLAVFFRPSLLKSIESRANRWISTRQMVKRMGVQHTAAEDLLQHSPRLVGISVILGSLYILINFALLRLG